ncbi:MAG TPA: hypothetical protein VFJ16_14830 [Longimicrobium sp.]|nr:hypothetical protein [Longimicrobium sp.]
MSHSIHLQPDELSRLVVQAATNAQNEGFWTGSGGAAEDAARHLTRYLGLLLGGDNDVSPHEMRIFREVCDAATGRSLGDDELAQSVTDAVAIADDPDAVEDFLLTTPPFLRAVIEMDRARGTRNAEQVVTALSGLALAMLAADGKAELEEDAVFTTHLNHLRGELARDGLAGKD